MQGEGCRKERLRGGVALQACTRRIRRGIATTRASASVGSGCWHCTRDRWSARPSPGCWRKPLPLSRSPALPLSRSPSVSPSLSFTLSPYRSLSLSRDRPLVKGGVSRQNTPPEHTARAHGSVSKRLGWSRYQGVQNSASPVLGAHSGGTCRIMRRARTFIRTIACQCILPYC